MLSAQTRSATVPATLPANLRHGLSKSQLPALDGLRAIAAFLVVFGHSGLAFMPADLGVLAFFVLSGFLITWLLLREDEEFGSVSLRLFYIRRSLRIFPAFYVYWLLVVGSRIVLGRDLNWPQAIASFFYVNNYWQAINGDPSTSLSHTWSLGVEEQFYLLWPLAFVFIKSSRSRLVKTLLVVILLVWIRRLFLFWIGTPEGYIYEAFDTRADHLAIGCLLAVSVRSRMWPKLWGFLCSRPAMAFIPVAVLIASTVGKLTVGTDYKTLGSDIIEPLAVAALIIQLISFSPTSALWSWINAGWIRYLGRISYSTYLYQQLVPHYLEKTLGSWPLAYRLPLIVAFVILLASLSYYLIERPFLKVKDRFAKRTSS